MKTLDCHLISVFDAIQTKGDSIAAVEKYIDGFRKSDQEEILVCLTTTLDATEVIDVQEPRH